MTAMRGMYPLDSSTPSLRRAQPRLIGRSAPAGTLFLTETATLVPPDLRLLEIGIGTE